MLFVDTHENFHFDTLSVVLESIPWLLLSKSSSFVIFANARPQTDIKFLINADKLVIIAYTHFIHITICNHYLPLQNNPFYL